LDLQIHIMVNVCSMFCIDCQGTIRWLFTY